MIEFILYCLFVPISFWVVGSTSASWGWLYKNYKLNPKTRLWMGFNEFMYFSSWWTLLFTVVIALTPFVNITFVFMSWMFWAMEGGMSNQPFKKWSKHKLEWEKDK